MTVDEATALFNAIEQLVQDLTSSDVPMRLLKRADALAAAAEPLRVMVRDAEKA